MSIRINKMLSKNAHSNPTKETTQKSISQLCEEVESQGLVIPIFQRDLAWTTQKKIDLYNFQLNGFAPVAPISINNTGAKSLDMPHVTLLNRSEVENLKEGKLMVIDGQQRISTNYQAYINHESIQEVVFDISRGVFTDLKGKKIKKNQIPVGILYNKEPSIFTDYIKNHKPLMEFDVSSLLGQIRTKIFNYFYTINFAHDLSGDQQIEWFDVLNLAGSRVPEIQMKLTRLQIKGLDFYKEYADVFRNKVEMAGLDDLFIQINTRTSIPLATLNSAIEVISDKRHTLNYSPIPSDTKESFISDMEIDDLRRAFNMTLEGLNSALDFISENNLSNPSRIDYITYLTGYFVFNKNKEISYQNKNNLVDWYNNVNFSNKTNSERRKMFDQLININLNNEGEKSKYE